MKQKDDNELLSRQVRKPKWLSLISTIDFIWIFFLYSSVISKCSLMNVYHLYNQKKMQVLGLFDFFFKDWPMWRERHNKPLRRAEGVACYFALDGSVNYGVDSSREKPISLPSYPGLIYTQPKCVTPDNSKWSTYQDSDHTPSLLTCPK